MPIAPLTSLALGYYSKSSLPLLRYGSGKDSKDIKSRNLAWNVMNVIGYVPILGIISGIFRQMVLNSNNVQGNEFANFRKIQGVRSWTEIFGTGFLFLIPDIIFTIGRDNMIKSYARNHIGLPGIRSHTQMPATPSGVDKPSRVCQIFPEQKYSRQLRYL